PARTCQHRARRRRPRSGGRGTPPADRRRSRRAHARDVPARRGRLDPVGLNPPALRTEADNPMENIARRPLPSFRSAALGPAAAHPPRGPERTADGAADLLRRMPVPTGPATADGPVWSPLATGFASVPTDELTLGAVGGLGGPVIDVTTAEELADALQHDGPA